MTKLTREELFARLRTEPLEITFKKEDNSKRTITASLQDGYIKAYRKETLAQMESGVNGQNKNRLRVYSVLDGGFRIIDVTRIVPNGIREINTETMTPVRRAARKAPAKRTTTTATPVKRTTRRAARA